ncbi:MAG: DciA family protein [Desulfomonilaceae bacterium]
MKRKTRSNVTMVGSVLGEVLHRMGLEAPLARHNVARLWPKIVDSAVARHAKVESVSGSTLFLAVDSSVWMNEMSAIRNLLLEKVNASLPPNAVPFTEIRFMQRSWAGTEDRKPQASLQPEMTDQESRVIGKILEPVKDPDLKIILRKILDQDRKLKWKRDTKE